MRHWCLVTSRQNWDVCKRHSVWGMDFRYFVTLQRFVRPADRAVVYAHGGDFVADVEIVSEAYEDFTPIGWTKNRQPFLFPYRIKIRILKEGRGHVRFSTDSDGERALHTTPNLIDEIAFIADKSRTWNQYLQVSIVPISREDFETIASRL
jgi:predicted RNA-binding protein